MYRKFTLKREKEVVTLEVPKTESLAFDYINALMKARLLYGGVWRV